MSDALAGLVAAQRIADLEFAYAQCIDEDRLEAWADFFADDCTYRVVPRENADYGLPLAVIDCDRKEQLRDRVLILRSATVFTLRLNRHIVTDVHVAAAEDGVYQVDANYAVYVTDLLDGTTQMFSTGRYADKVVFVADEPKFKEKLVVLDTFSVANHISSPL